MEMHRSLEEKVANEPQEAATVLAMCRIVDKDVLGWHWTGCPHAGRVARAGQAGGRRFVPARGRGGGRRPPSWRLFLLGRENFSKFSRILADAIF
jgi:hypothetical protein